MAGAAPPELLQDAVVYLAAAAVAVPVFMRFGLGAVLGYLAAGVAIGPRGFALVGSAENVGALAEFGIVLLLFVIGLELKPKRLWAMRRDIFGLGALQLAVCGLLLTGMLLLLTSLSPSAALAIGLPLALSSTALVLGLLRENNELNTPVGDRAFSILLFQDVAIVPLLIITAALSRVPSAGTPDGLTLALSGFGAIIGLVLVGRFLLNPALRLLAHLGAREVFVIVALLTVLAAALLMGSLGLSMALGAFVAGLMLAESPYRHEIEADIEPFRGLLLGLFFVSVGMSLDLAVLVQEPLRVAALVAAVMGVKALAIAALCRLFGTPGPDALRLGVLLSQGGEFAFVLIAAAVSGLLIAPAAGALFSVVVTVSMALSLLLVAAARLLPQRAPMDAEAEAALPEGLNPGTVIVVGYGRFGQILTQMLHARGVDVVLIDAKQAQIEQSAGFGWRVYYGDGFRPDVLRAAGAETAGALIFANGGKRWDPQRLAPVRRAFPNLAIIVRAYDRGHAMQLHAVGERLVVRELFGSAIECGRMALRELGATPEAIDAITEEFLRRDSERLALQSATGDLLAGRDRVFRPGAPWEGARGDPT